MTVEDITPGGVPARLYCPTENNRDILVWLHGGGWPVGDLECCDSLARALANRAQCAVLSVDYRLAPGHPYPAAIDDSWAATIWAWEHFETVAVGGDCAGGNLAVAVAIRARDAQRVLALPLLVFPAVDSRVDGPFVDHYVTRHTALLGCEDFGETESIGVRKAWDTYVVEPARRSEPDASPVHVASLAGVAPAFIVLAEHDMLRGEGEEYTRRLEAAGVEVEVELYAGQVHGFYGMLAFHEARNAAERSVMALRRAFARELQQQTHE